MNTEKVALHNRIFLSVGVLLAVVAVSLPADPVNPSGESAFAQITMGATPEEVRESLGPPAFAEPPILLYSWALTTAKGQLPADLTLWFSSNRLFFASYAFPVLGLSAEDLNQQFGSVSALLTAIYGESSSRASATGIYITEVWNDEEMGVEHTLIVEPGRVEHVLTLTAPQL